MKTNSDLLKRLIDGAVCLTATNRLSRQIMADYDQYMIDSGRTAWNRPTIMPLESWCRQLITSLDLSERILTPSQAAFLWEIIIQKDIAATDHELLQITSTARKARQAYKLLHDFQSGFSAKDAAEDHRAFLRWQKAWEEMLAGKGWIDPCTIISHIIKAIDAGEIKVESGLVFAGFDDFNPVQRTLQNSLETSGCSVEIDNESTAVSSNVGVVSVPDNTTEVEQCARWARKLVADFPEVQIGIVAPHLESYKSLLCQKFLDEFDPAGKVHGSGQLRPFNISLGDPLANEGPAFAALKLLALPRIVGVDELSWLLRTPYIQDATDKLGHRGVTDAKFRKKRLAELPLWKLKGVLRSIGCDNAFSGVIDTLIDFQKSNRKDLPGVWAERFARTLQSSGWPGDRSLSSREYQAVNKFREVLAGLASLDAVSGQVDRSFATALVQRLTNEATFQPESSGSQVQILGMLEAGGLHFDHLWVLGMHAGAMPQPLRPNPFIPLDLQRRKQMPHADANRELSYAKRLIKRLSASSTNIVFSWPLNEDGIENRPGALLQSVPSVDLPTLPSMAPAAAIFGSRLPLESLSDYKVSPLLSKKPVSGGTAIVKDQALCPFRAFAHHRLSAKGIESPDIGLDNMTRGTLVHSMLEFFWTEVRSHQRFCQMTDEEIQATLEKVAEMAIAREEATNKADMPSRLRLLEIQRLIIQGGKWLERERNRSSFDVVEQEQLHEETIGRLHFRTRIDRIDRLDDGTLAIIDYKTGQPDPLQWFGRRISEPQLPIYCQKLENKEIGAVLFAAVRNKPAECRFSGLARTPEKFPKLNERQLQKFLNENGWETIDQVLDSWREALPELGNAFVNGDAAIDPVEKADTCKYCDLATLCRIHESEHWAGWEAGNV